MLRCLFKNTKAVDVESLRSRIESLECYLDAARRDLDNQNRQLLSALEWNEKFKAVMERLRAEKWELETENEFLRKKVKEFEGANMALKNI